ncbi:MAG: hypothetical protein KIT84_21600 [Labilithrix sp.]|nr:hypothetical protein [Labilithrix sp.]MCW5813640.1 hypothetical protein [Labilithrix sp.]
MARAETYDGAKLRFVGACAAIAGGLAIAGSLDRTTGGVIVLCGWIAGVATLHRLGRAGSDRTSDRAKKSVAPAPEAEAEPEPPRSDVRAKDDDADVGA